jgi:hypothetical protein
MALSALESHHHIDMPEISVGLMSAENEGSQVDFVWGVAMGLILGFFMIFLVCCVSYGFF